MNEATTVPAKKTFDVKGSYIQACAVKGYLQTQFKFLDVEITGNDFRGYKVVVEWQSDSQENIELEISGIQEQIDWVLTQK